MFTTVFTYPKVSVGCVGWTCFLSCTVLYDSVPVQEHFTVILKHGAITTTSITVFINQSIIIAIVIAITIIRIIIVPGIL